MSCSISFIPPVASPAESHIGLLAATDTESQDIRPWFAGLPKMDQYPLIKAPKGEFLSMRLFGVP
jgi:hypothetical protein